MPDLIDTLVSHLATPPNWYDRDCEWYEIILYENCGDPHITGRAANYDFEDSLSFAREARHRFGDHWRIIHHGKQSIKIAESK